MERKKNDGIFPIRFVAFIWRCSWGSWGSPF